MPAGTGTISGTVWWDRNANGFRELDESAVAAWPVYLQADVDNSPIQQTTTNDSGAYTFSELDTGFYFVWSVDSRGDTPKTRIEVNEVGIPVSRDIGSIGWKWLFPQIFAACQGESPSTCPAWEGTALSPIPQE